MTTIGRVEATLALEAAYDDVTRLVTALDDARFLQPSRCLGWSVADVLFHLLLDPQRALVAFATPASLGGNAASDADYVSYWRAGAADDDPTQDHALFVRRSALAYRNPASIARHWQSTAEAAVRAAHATTLDRILTQDRVLAVPDFIATLAFEACMHYLDMVGHLDGAPTASQAPLGVVRRTLDGLLDAPSPPWDDVTYALKGTGRLALSEADRVELGEVAEAFPLLGATAAR